jgi:hypothetical protein
MTQQVVSTGVVAGDGTGSKGQVPWNAFNTNSTELYKNAFFFGLDTGAVNAYVVTLANLLPGPAAAVSPNAATIFRFTPNTPNTGPATLAFSGGAPTAILNQFGAALTGGELTGLITLQFNGTAWQIFGGGMSQGTFDNFLAGVTFTGVVNGSPPALFLKTSNYTGGTVGFVNPTFFVEANVANCGNNYEWGILSVMNNSSATGQNVAVYGQGNRQLTTAGATWGGVMEVREVVALNNPTHGLVGLEVDNRSNGTDSSGNRIGIDVVAARFNTSGAATTVTYGVRVQNNADATVAITNAFSVVANNVGFAFDCANATVTSASLRMASQVPIQFDAAGVNQLLYDTVGLTYKVSGTAETRLLPSGGLAVNTSGTVVQVVGPRIAGWGASSNGVRGAINGVTATLAQTAAGLAQLIIDLQTHGLLGT